MSFRALRTLGGVKRTIYNQYDSIVRPVEAWLKDRGVRFVSDGCVTNLDLADEGGTVRVKDLTIEQRGTKTVVTLADDDLVFFQNGSMTDASSLGSMTSPPKQLTKADSQGWALWETIAAGRPEFGNPAAFNRSIPESYWASFTVTCRDRGFFEQMETFSGNAAGTGGLVTFKDSNWLMSVVLYHQPHFVGQPSDVEVFWGYALHPDRIGNFVPKPMSECGGADILRELCGHLNFDNAVFQHATCIPCRMPYITSMFMPRLGSDRPLPVPPNSVNLAFVSQFVEIPDEVVFTVEHSVRAAQMAVYQLLGIKRSIPPITRHDKSISVLIHTLEKAFV